jgi:hypothetical protein
VAAGMSSHGVPLPATALGTLAPATMPTFSNADAYNRFLFPQLVSPRQFVDILSD